MKILLPTAVYWFRIEKIDRSDLGAEPRPMQAYIVSNVNENPAIIVEGSSFTFHVNFSIEFWDIVRHVLFKTPLGVIPPKQ